MLALTAGLLTRDPLTDLDTGRAVLQAIHDCGPSLYPDQVRGGAERLAPWTSEALPTYYERPFQLDLVAGRDQAEWLFTSRLGRRFIHGNINAAADADAVSPREMPAVIRSLATSLPTDFGYVHWITPGDLVERVAAGVLVDDPGAPYMVVNSADLGHGLPDLMWGTVLGPAMADLVGDEIIRTCPAHLVEEIAPRTFWVQLTADISDCPRDRDRVIGARAKARAHLGEDIFGNERHPASRRVVLPIPRTQGDVMTDESPTRSVRPDQFDISSTRRARM